MTGWIGIPFFYIRKGEYIIVCVIGANISILAGRTIILMLRLKRLIWKQFREFDLQPTLKRITHVLIFFHCIFWNYDLGGKSPTKYVELVFTLEEHVLKVTW